MLVNDGQKHRGFRKNIFNEDLFITGIAAGAPFDSIDRRLI
jgi:hypothetical protein